MENVYTPCLMINIDAEEAAAFKYVGLDAEYTTLVNEGWASVSFKKMVYQTNSPGSSKVKISAGTVGETPVNPFYTKLDDRTLQWFAESNSPRELEGKFRQMVGGVGFAGWKETGVSQVYSTNLVLYTEVGEGYTLPERSHWVEIDLETVDLRDCLENYLKEGIYPPELELYKTIGVDRYPVLLAARHLLVQHKLSK